MASERQPLLHKPYRHEAAVKVYTQAAILSFGSVLFGYDSSFIGTTISQPSFQRAFQLTRLSGSERVAVVANITSSFQLGAFVGSLLSFGIIEWLGRRRTLIHASIVFLVGAVLQTSANVHLVWIYVGRAICGLAVGFITAASPAYIAEIAPVGVRGRLTGFFEMSYQAGCIFGFFINYVLNRLPIHASPNLWRLPMGFQVLPALVLLVGTFSLEEAPIFHLKRDDLAKAQSVLAELRQLPSDHVEIEEELDSLRHAIKHERSILNGHLPTLGNYLRAALREAVRPGIRNRLAIIFLMFAFSNSSGAVAINYYTPQIYKSVGLEDSAIDLWTGLYGLSKAISTAIFLIHFIDLVGRRKPWILSSVLCALCMIVLAGCVRHLHQPGAQAAGGAGIAIGSVMCYAAFWAFGASSIPWTVASEIMPLSIRAFCAAYTAAIQWLCQYAITKAAPYLLDRLGYGAFLFFAGSLLASAAWCYCCMPETNQVKMEDMDALFGFVEDDKDRLLGEAAGR